MKNIMSEEMKTAQCKRISKGVKSGFEENNKFKEQAGIISRRH